MEYPTLLLSKTTPDIYQSHGEDVYENLSKGRAGKLTEEDATKYLEIPLVLNYFAMKNTLIVNLVKTMGFQYEGLISHGTEEELKQAVHSIGLPDIDKLKEAINTI